MCAQIHRWGLGHIQTCKSGPKVAVLNAQNHKWGLGPFETRNSGDNHAVLNAHNYRWSLWPIETCNSGPKVSVLHAKTTGDGWDTYRLVILVLRTPFAFTNPQVRSGIHRDLYGKLFCSQKCTDQVWNKERLAILVVSTLFRLHKSTGEVWDPERLVILVLKSLFCIHTTTGEGACGFVNEKQCA